MLFIKTESYQHLSLTPDRRNKNVYPFFILDRAFVGIPHLYDVRYAVLCLLNSEMVFLHCKWRNMKYENTNLSK